MPVVNGKHYSYDKAGVKKAMKAKKEHKPGYSKDVVAMAMKMKK